MALVLVLLCMSLVIVKGEGSHCMVTTNGVQHGLSLYLRVCCVNSNLNWDRDLKQENKYILCPSVRLLSCPPEACGLAGTQVVHMMTTAIHMYHY